jgi:hypothetical protein
VWEAETDINNLLAKVQVTAKAVPHPFDGETFFIGPGTAGVFLPVLLH